MNLKQFVLSIIQPIEDGKTVTTECPNCGVKKFTATVVDDYVLFNCYSGSCRAKFGTSGKFNLSLSPEERVERLRRTVMVEPDVDFKVPSYWVDGIGDDRCLKYMEANHMLQAYKDGLFRPMYDPSEQRFVFPIRAVHTDGLVEATKGLKRGSSGEVVGAVGRTLIGDSMKVRNYNRTFETPFICGDSKVILLTEDCASAVAATRGGYCAGMALLGTRIRKEFIKYLSNYQWVGIALDKDAYKQSFILKKVLTTYLKDVRIRKLPKDIKDMSDSEYETWWQKNA